MSSAMSPREMLEFLRLNHHKLSEQVDLESMSEKTLQQHIDRSAKVRPFRILTWTARQGFFISAWSLWEYTANQLCEQFPVQTKKQSSELTIAWIGRTTAANGRTFRDQTWFESANPNFDGTLLG